MLEYSNKIYNFIAQKALSFLKAGGCKQLAVYRLKLFKKH
jgi:hypothetical protein